MIVEMEGKVVVQGFGAERVLSAEYVHLAEGEYVHLNMNTDFDLAEYVRLVEGECVRRSMNTDFDLAEQRMSYQKQN